MKNSYLFIPNQRLKWYGIDPLEDAEAEKFKDIYGGECECKFDVEGDFNCECRWKEQTTLKEHKSFQDLRKVSKSGIYGQPNIAIDHL